MPNIYTIGHSNHKPDEFLHLLHIAGIDALVDIRSNPNSKWAQFANRGSLKPLLESSGIKYSYMGKTLGGHPSGEEFYNLNNGKVDYDQIRDSEAFKKDIDLLVQNSERYAICLMCAEENPANCHRSLLVAKELGLRGVNIVHIRGDERLQSEEDLTKERAKVPVNQHTLL